MKFNEIIKQAENGSKIRRAHWSPSYFIQLNEKNEFIGRYRDKYNIKLTSITTADDWEIYTYTSILAKAYTSLKEFIELNTTSPNTIHMSIKTKKHFQRELNASNITEIIGLEIIVDNKLPFGKLIIYKEQTYKFKIGDIVRIINSSSNKFWFTKGTENLEIKQINKNDYSVYESDKSDYCYIQESELELQPQISELSTNLKTLSEKIKETIEKYQPKETPQITHDFNWAIKQLNLDHQVRRHFWGTPTLRLHISVDEYKNLLYSTSKKTDIKCDFLDLEILNATDWEKLI